MFMNAKKGMRYDDAGLVYKTSAMDNCLSFWYNMRGAGAGAIEVVVDDNLPALELKGPKDTDWHRAQVMITEVNKEVRYSSRQLCILSGLND